MSRFFRNFRAIATITALVFGFFTLALRKLSQNILKTSLALGKPQGRVLWIHPEKTEITLPRNSSTEQVGQYTLIFGEHELGLAKIGPVISKDTHTVTRELHRVNQGKIRIGDPVWQKSWYYNEPEEISPDFVHLNIPSRHGILPSWAFLSEKSKNTGRWAVLIHGRGADMRETLKAVPVLNNKGIHCLVISYRNDEVATPTPNHLGGLGMEEWEDVESSIDFLEQIYGAEEIILAGWSMGASISTQYLLNTQHKRKKTKIVGVLFDCPAVEWESILRDQADASKLPQFLQDSVLCMLTHPLGQKVTGATQPLDFEQLSILEHYDLFTMPTLILQGSKDLLTLPIFSETLQSLNPEKIEIELFEDATHVRTWNSDHERWEKRVSDWLDQQKLSATAGK